MQRLSVIVIVLILLAPETARADELEAALALEEQGLLLEALEAFQALLHGGANTQEEVAIIYLHSSMLQLASGDRAAARESMDRLLAVESNPTLPETAPPAVAELLEEARRLWGPRRLRGDASGAEALEAGEPAIIDVAVIDDVPGLVGSAALIRDGRRVAESSGRPPFELELLPSAVGIDGVGTADLEVQLLDEHDNLLWQGSPFAVSWIEATTPEPAVPAPSTTTPRRNRPLWISGWTLFASGVLLVGGGATLVAIDELETGAEQITERGREIEVLDTDVSGWTLLAIGGAALITSVVLLIVSSRRAHSSRLEALLERVNL